ncbi:MAG: hypothetical protein PHT78_06420 [Desulfitobacteriaceae bacterium]|nr:hypothetical protein [Desulfitobacteriaceae bacterium]MDD4752871.1 hypothetical protein [Desulfitobacteriaceae bacterium]
MIIDVQIDSNYFFDIKNTRTETRNHKIIDPLIDPNTFIDITSW